jgi:minor extracellular serine protease Vpr
VNFSLANDGASAATYTFSLAPNSALRGAVISFTPGSVSVAAGERSSVQVSLSMSAAAFAALPSDDTFTVGPGGVVTVRGDIVATPAAGHATDQQTLRLPFMLVPRGLSNVVAGAPSDFSNATAASAGTPGNTIAATLPITNNGIHAGTANLFAWGIHEALGNGQPNNVRDVGVQVVPAGPLGGTAGDRGLVFLINTWGQSANQSVNEYDILIDTNGDGVPDFVVVGADIGHVLTGAFDGRFGAFTINAKTRALVDANFADAPMNGSTIELPLLASDLGLSQRANGVGPVKKEGFTYSVRAFSIVPGGAADVTGSAAFNPFSPSVSSGDFAPLAAGSSTSFTLTVDTDQQKAQPALGWLVASVDNANGAAQAGEVPLSTK